MRDRPYLLFFGLATGAFVVAHIGFEIFARLWFGRGTGWEAVGQTLFYSAIQPVGSVMRLGPFVLLGWMAASLAKMRTQKSGTILFAAGAAVLGLMYFDGHMGAEQAIQHRRWTAASLSIELLPFQSIPVLFVVLAIRLLAGRRRDDRNKVQKE